MADAMFRSATARAVFPAHGPVARPTRRLLLVDDDAPLRNRLSKAFTEMGLAVVAGTTLSEARARLAAGERFEAAVLELRLRDGNGLDLIGALRQTCPGIRIVVLTAFNSIATAVLAIKAGAADYLTKPTDPATIARALSGAEHRPLISPDLPMPPDRVRWEHIQRLYEQCGRNVSATARHLGMHRRSLQRILAKRAPREQTPHRVAVAAVRTTAPAEARIGA